MVNGCAIKWRTKRQATISNSTTEAELIALNALALDAEWLRLMFGDLKVPHTGVLLLCDNQASERLAKNPIASDRTKHIEIKHRKIQEMVEHGKMEVEWVSTRAQLADLFTKQLNKTQFDLLRAEVGVVDLSK